MKKITRPNEVFNILEKKIKTHVPLKVDVEQERVVQGSCYMYCHHIFKIMGQPGKVANPARGQL